MAEPRLEIAYVSTADGRRLPLRRWLAGDEVAVVLALHGFNDYGAAFAKAGAWWAEQGITTYAFDQRGFGAAPEPGIWPGAELLASDARAALALVKARHSGKPVYLLGNSMGAAVALTALRGQAADTVAGVILSAPAVWGSRAMSPFYRLGLWLGAHLTPANFVTGRGLGRLASDNIQMLRALGRDPLIIKKTRIDVVYGLTLLMGEGLEAAAELKVPALVLYGALDEIVPAGPVAEMVRVMGAPKRLAVYGEGWHMLLRDCQANVVWRDIAAWIRAPKEALPSGQEVAEPALIKTTERGPVAESCPGS